jgi:ABC-type uncharacterized transport system substrate-binding protein
MSFKTQRKKSAVILTFVFILSQGINNFNVYAEDGKGVAVVYLKQIRPYKTLSDSIVNDTANKTTVKVFGLENKDVGDEIEQELRLFKPSVVVCIGDSAYKSCRGLNSVRFVLAYNTDLLKIEDPLCLLKYLKADTKSVLAIVDENCSSDKCQTLTELASRQELKLAIKKSKPDSWREILSNNDAVFLDEGVLIIKPDGCRETFNGGPVVAVGQQDNQIYKGLTQICMTELPKIDRFIDIGAYETSRIRQELVDSKCSVILCIGASAYYHCKFMQERCPVLVALKTKSLEDDIELWGNISGVNMFIEPQVQTDMLHMLIKKGIHLAMPYDPQNTEELALKALLTVENGIEIVPLSVSNHKHLTKVVDKAFLEYDGIWIIPDSTVSIGPVRDLVLERSLREGKILVSMMHPYVKSGAAMAVSSTGGDETVLCKKVLDVINHLLRNPESCGQIITSPVSVSLNVRTIERLNYDVPEALLKQSEYVFGKD